MLVDVTDCSGPGQRFRLPSMAVTLFIIITGLICTIAAVIGIWQAVLPRDRRFLRRRAAIPAVEPPPQRAVQPPPQVVPAPIVILPGQAPNHGGAASTFPGPGTTSGTTSFATFGSYEEKATVKDDPPAPGPVIGVSDSDSAVGQDG
jgi:hypothetical protein